MKRLLEYAEEGDTVVVWRVDRLGRSLIDVLNTVALLPGRGVQVLSISDGIDPATSTGRLMLNMLATLAEYERELIVERVNVGIAAARQNGTRFGRPGRHRGQTRDRPGRPRQRPHRRGRCPSRCLEQRNALPPPVSPRRTPEHHNLDRKTTRCSKTPLSGLIWPAPRSTAPSSLRSGCKSAFLFSAAVLRIARARFAGHSSAMLRQHAKNARGRGRAGGQHPRPLSTRLTNIEASGAGPGFLSAPPPSC